MPWYLCWRYYLDEYWLVYAVGLKVAKVYGDNGSAHDLVPSYFYAFDTWKLGAIIRPLPVSADYVPDIYSMCVLLLLHDALANF